VDGFSYVLKSWGYVTIGLVSALAFSLILGFFAAFTVKRARNTEPTRNHLNDVYRAVFLSFGMGFLAWVVGYITGASRSAIAGELVTSVLTAVGTIGAIAGLHFNQVIPVAMILVSFAFSLFIGTTLGSNVRMENEEVDRLLPPYETMRDEAQKEALIKDYREGLHLKWPPPVYQPIGSSKKDVEEKKGE